MHKPLKNKKITPPQKIKKLRETDNQWIKKITKKIKNKKICERSERSLVGGVPPLPVGLILTDRPKCPNLAFSFFYTQNFGVRFYKQCNKCGDANILPTIFKICYQLLINIYHLFTDYFLKIYYQLLIYVNTNCIAIIYK